MLRRILPLAVVASLLFSIVPSPALALSTQNEIAIGQQYDEDIVASSVIETDPLLNAYVRSVSNKLWAQTARKDIPYNIKIIKGNDINAYATLGGFMYCYEGLVDFVQSDDELAGVLGHETGHVERRHVVTSQAKAQLLNLIFGIASLFSPFMYRFGNLIGAGLMAKNDRANELQADRYGLQLMSRAGYDPEAMVSMMWHLSTQGDEHNDLVSKYLEDHPGESDRVKHLMGYPELDPTKTTADQLLAQSLSDEERARYNFSSLKLQKEVLAKEPNNAQALLALGRSQLALGQTGKSAQTLAEAAQKGSTQTRALAEERISALREMDRSRVMLPRPNIGRLHEDLDRAQQQLTQQYALISVRRDEGRDQIKNLQNRLDALNYEIPDFSRIQVRPNSNLQQIVRNLETMFRSVNSGVEDSKRAIVEVGSLDRGKEGGAIKISSDLLRQMRAPLEQSPIPSDSIALFAQYPQTLSEIEAANNNLLQGVDAGRAADVLMDEGLGDLDAFLKALGRVQPDFNGDVSKMDYNALLPQMQKVKETLDAAAIAASHAVSLYQNARSRQNAAMITLLGVGTSPQRYSTLRYALDNRFTDLVKNGTKYDGVPYETMLKDDLTPGDVTLATIIAADTKNTTVAVIDDAKVNRRSMVDEGNAKGIHSWPIEILSGLVWLDYTDNPADEMPHGK